MRTSSVSELASLTAASTAADIVREVPRLLHMDAAFAVQRVPGGGIVRSLSGAGAGFDLVEGMHLRDGAFEGGTRGRDGALVHDAGLALDTRPAVIAAAAHVGAYAWAPLQFSDGFPYGMLCAVSHASRPRSEPGQLQLLEFVARMLCDILEREDLRESLQAAESSDAALTLLLATLDDRDAYAQAHTTAVAEQAVAVAGQLGLTDDETVDVRHVAMLHDVGKLLIPETILRKPATLSPGEWRVMRSHSTVTEDLLSHVPSLRHLCPAVRAVHENWDGTGYPDGLVGTDIAMESRIVHVCHAFESMTRDRPYRPALSQQAALMEIASCAGGQFSPEVVSALLSVLRQSPARPGSPASATGIRCECLDCGTHTILDSAFRIAGQCSNCRSYHLVALGERQGSAAA